MKMFNLRLELAQVYFFVTTIGKQNAFRANFNCLMASDDFEIKRMLKEVRKQIKLLEKAFFEEEDSE